jgi:hypothetical protein
MSSHWRAALVFAVVFAAGCSRETAAREKFAKDRSCPLEGVTAKPRPDLSAHDLTFSKSTPPPEIAADAARLRLWQAEEDKKKKSWDDATTLFEVSGCKEKAFYGCSPSKKKAVSCSSISPKTQ